MRIKRELAKLTAIITCLLLILSSFGGWVPTADADVGSVTLEAAHFSADEVVLRWDPYTPL